MLLLRLIIEQVTREEFGRTLADREGGELQLFRRELKCLHHYLYLIDDEFGFIA